MSWVWLFVRELHYVASATAFYFKLDASDDVDVPGMWTPRRRYAHRLNTGSDNTNVQRTSTCTLEHETTFRESSETTQFFQTTHESL